MGWSSRVYQFWDLASTNLQAALARIAPQLKPLGSLLVQIAADAGTGIIKFFIAIVVAGLLFAAPRTAAVAWSETARASVEGLLFLLLVAPLLWIFERRTQFVQKLI